MKSILIDINKKRVASLNLTIPLLLSKRPVQPLTVYSKTKTFLQYASLNFLLVGWLSWYHHNQHLKSNTYGTERRATQ